MNTFAGIHHTNPILCRRLAFVLPRNVPKNPLTTKQTRILGLRVKELFQLQTDDELNHFAGPRVANIVTLAEFLLQGTLNKGQVHQKLVELRNELCLHYSEFNSQCFQEPPPLDKRKQLVEIVQSNLPHSCD